MSKEETELASRFMSVAEQVLAELRGLRGELATRPTRTEQTLRRRMSAVVLLLVGWCGLMANDHHVAGCSPGARASKAVEYVSKTPPKDYSNAELRRLLRQPLPESCDISYPIEAHDIGAEWPTSGNVIGLGIYSGLLLGLYLWYRWPAFRERRELDKNFSRDRRTL